MIKRDDVFKYIEKQYGTQPDYPWEQYPSYAVFRHDKNEKWYVLIMTVEKVTLGLVGNEKIDILDLKVQPELIDVLKQSKGFLLAYHMNKNHWVSVLLDGSVPIEEIQTLIDTSYRLTDK